MACLNDYSEGFDTDAYLTSRFTVPGPPEDSEFPMHNFAVKTLHDYFRSKAGSSNFSELKVLDYGCGPVIANVISAASLASEIVLAEYTEEGRTALRRWLNRDPSSFNWSPHFKYVVQTLEGKSFEDAAEREERVRRVVKAVVRCDVTQDPPIQKGYEGPYDIVICCLCLSNACRTKVDYLNAVSKIATLLKLGGVLLLSTIESENLDGSLEVYTCGTNKHYHALRLNQVFVLETLEQVGFDDITAKRLAANPWMESVGLKGTLTFAAHKKPF